jgi:hypothetical protein
LHHELILRATRRREMGFVMVIAKGRDGQIEWVFHHNVGCVELRELEWGIPEDIMSVQKRKL